MTPLLPRGTRGKAAVAGAIAAEVEYAMERTGFLPGPREREASARVWGGAAAAAARRQEARSREGSEDTDDADAESSIGYWCSSTLALSASTSPRYPKFGSSPGRAPA
jgi:hypothetical protein